MAFAMEMGWKAQVSTFGMGWEAQADWPGLDRKVPEAFRKGTLQDEVFSEKGASSSAKHPSKVPFTKA